MRKTKVWIPRICGDDLTVRAIRDRINPRDLWVCRTCNLTISKNNPSAHTPNFCAQCGSRIVLISEVEKTIDVPSSTQRQIEGAKDE
jgi:DNA-directed RNA polymerase subunit RPC12/RpoP